MALPLNPKAVDDLWSAPVGWSERSLLRAEVRPVETKADYEEPLSQSHRPSLSTICSTSIDLTVQREIENREGELSPWQR